MSEWEADEPGPAPVWLTADECVSAHGIDPMRLPTGKVRNKLVLRAKRSLIRVWLEDDVLNLKKVSR